MILITISRQYRSSLGTIFCVQGFNKFNTDSFMHSYIFRTKFSGKANGWATLFLLYFIDITNVKVSMTSTFRAYRNLYII